MNAEQIESGIIKLKKPVTLPRYYWMSKEPMFPVGTEIDLIETEGEYCYFHANYGDAIFMIDVSNLPWGFMTEKEYIEEGDDSLGSVFALTKDKFKELFMTD